MEHESKAMGQYMPCMLVVFYLIYLRDDIMLTNTFNIFYILQECSVVSLAKIIQTVNETIHRSF